MVAGDHQVDGDFALLADGVRVVGVLKELEKDAVAVLRTDDLVQALQALVHLQAAPLPVQGVLKLRASDAADELRGRGELRRSRNHQLLGAAVVHLRHRFIHAWPPWFELIRQHSARRKARFRCCRWELQHEESRPIACPSPGETTACCRTTKVPHSKATGRNRCMAGAQTGSVGRLVWS